MPGLFRAFLVIVLAQSAAFVSAQALTPVRDSLKGLKSISVQVGNNTFDAAFKADVESQLRQAGMRILNPDQQSQGGATLWIEAIADGSAASVSVQLLEAAILTRDNNGSPTVRTGLVTSWQRIRTFQAAQSAQEIIAPFKENPLLARAFYGYEETGIMSPALQQLIPTITDLQVRAAQRPSLSMIRNYASAFVNDFVSQWLASNPKTN